jgi:hydrogenase-4 component B
VIDPLPALLGVALGAFLAGAVAVVLFAARPGLARGAAYGLGAVGSGAAAAAGALALLGTPWTLAVPWLLPRPGVELALDRLGGLFLLVIGGAGLPASVYALGYTRDQGDAGRGEALAYDAFLGAMTLVVLGANLFTFLIAWELMALASYFLVVADPGTRAVTRAGWTYAVVTHAGLACLIAGMLVLVQATGSERFADWVGAASSLAPATRTAAFVLLALGFGSKAGLVPLHVWLPVAHPVAPSHASALMSGVMVKLGVYGLLRAGFEWLGDGPPWWGALLILVGGASALLGVLYALVEPDFKRLLAYSTVENVGLVALGVGAALVFRATGAESLALLGLVAALYHVVGHAAFKGVLFMGAGAVLHSTGTVHMEALGGLIRRMPRTATCVLLGSLAIAAMPPLAGFVSEWLLFQALLQSFQVPRPGLNLVFLLALGALALTGGLAVACFVRAFGIVYLAQPRSDAAAGAHEAPQSMRTGMYLLAGACVALGLLPTVVVPLLAAAVPGGRGAGLPPVLGVSGGALLVGPGFSSVSPVTVALLLALGVGAVLAALRLGGARRDRRAYETWSCGRSLQTSRMQYTATAFSQPFKRIFAVLYRPVKQLEIEFHAESRFFVRTIRYENPTRSLIEEWLYLPALARAQRIARLARRIQSGSANVYLAYIFAALLVSLLVAAR